MQLALENRDTGRQATLCHRMCVCRRGQIESIVDGDSKVTVVRIRGVLVLTSILIAVIGIPVLVKWKRRIHRVHKTWF
jgi:hypothetical protein